MVGEEKCPTIALEVSVDHNRCILHNMILLHDDEMRLMFLKEHLMGNLSGIRGTVFPQ